MNLNTLGLTENSRPETWTIQSSCKTFSSTTFAYRCTGIAILLQRVLSKAVSNFVPVSRIARYSCSWISSEYNHYSNPCTKSYKWTCKLVCWIELSHSNNQEAMTIILDFNAKWLRERERIGFLLEYEMMVTSI